MKLLDLKSVLVAGLIGGAILLAAGAVSSDSPGRRIGIGFVLGAGVQIGVRLLGVS